MSDQPINDPRPLYRGALNWVSALLEATELGALNDPTPCSEFSVRELAGHLVATVRRARVIGEGGDVRAQPQVIDGIEDFSAAYRAEIDQLWTVWDNDDLLNKTVNPPWGACPGFAAIMGYTNETLVHGWDLAVATGQPSEAPADLVEPVLAMATQMIPADPRGGTAVPFAEVVTSAADAGPTERLANWSGHTR